MADTFEDISNSVSNNGLLDPMQGYDADVWALDQATGKWILTGRFTTCELVFRNTTRPYIEFNQRVMRQLDGTFMMGFTMERGQLDGRALQQTFGYSRISRTIRVNRHPRMQITYQVNAPELHQAQENLNEENLFSESSNANLRDGISSNGTTTFEGFDKRNAKSMIVIENCKIETFTIRAEAGDEILSNRWEGVAEGYRVVDAASVWGGHYLMNNDQATATAADVLGQDSTINNVDSATDPLDTSNRTSSNGSSNQGFNLGDALDAIGDTLGF